MNIYLDASVIIYGIEGTDELRSAVLAWITETENGGGCIQRIGGSTYHAGIATHIRTIDLL